MVMRIAHFGTFDVENYGDLLFPLLAERRLGDLEIEWVHVSPVGGDAVWSDCRPTISIEDAFDSRFDAVIVGGGHILHARPAAVEAYRSGRHVAELAYAALWLGAGELAARLEVPIVWNAPGIPAAFGSRMRRLAGWAAAACDYLALRDQRSLFRIRQAGFAGRADVVIDTAIEVSTLWSESERKEAWRRAFEARGVSIPDRSLVFHFNERYLEEELDAVASRVARICTHVDAMPVLVALGPCHGDGKIAWEIGERLDRAALVVDRPESLREVAACIEHSVGYLGTSLHGLITAGAFERPALVVARESTSGAAKFSGFLNQWHDARAGMPTPRAGLVSTWAKAESVFCNDRFHSPNVEGELEPGLGTAFGSIPERMDAHWSAVADALIRPPNLRKSHRGGSRLALEGILQRSWRSREIFLEVLREQEERRAAG